MDRPSASGAATSDRPDDAAAVADPGDGDPPSAGPTAVRAALAYGVVAGALFLALVPVLRPDQIGVAADVYHHAASTALAGGDPYAVAPPDHPGFYFVYPPVVLLAFVPHALVGSELGAYLLQTALNLATAAALALALVRTVARVRGSLARTDRLLIAAFVVASVHSVSVLVMGQVNLQLALLVAVGGLLVERGETTAGPGSTGDPRSSAEAGTRATATAATTATATVTASAGAGAAFALAATVKLFPAAVGAWLLRRRDWRAIAGAAATGLGGFAVGLAAFGPARLRTYLTGTLPSEGQADAFAGGLSPEATFVTLRRPLGAAFPSTDPSLLALVAAGLLAPVVLASYRDVATGLGRRTALLATLLGTLVLLPLESFYFALVYYPLVPILYELPPGRERKLFAAGTVLLSTTVTYPALAGVLAAAPVPADVAGAVDAAVRAAFGVAQPPLAGVCLLLVGCVAVQRRLAVARRTEGPDGAAAVE